jgi:hypothetical protein
MHRRIPPLRAFLPALCAALIVLIPQPTHARDTLAQLPVAFVAADGDDTRDCATPATRCMTLQHAFDQLADGGEVRIAAGNYAGTTTISRSARVVGGYLLPNFSPGSAPTVLDARHGGTTLRIIGPSWVRLQQLNITGGLADASGLPEGQGGGIVIRRANVILDHVQVYANTASVGTSGKGGGVYISDGAALISHSAITDNIALQIGDPPPIHSGSLVGSDQTPDHTAPLRTQDLVSLTGSGGGIYAIRARIMVQDSQIAQNRAVSSSVNDVTEVVASGGGLHAEGSMIATLNTRFVSNWALAGSGASGVGGAIRLINSRALLNRSEISDNYASSESNTVGSGGGIALDGGETQVNDSALRRNSADLAGSGPGAGILVRPLLANTAITLTNVLLVEQRGTALELLAGQDGIRTRADVRYATLVSNTIGLQAGPGQMIAVVNSIIVGSTIAVQALDGGNLALAYTDRYDNLAATAGAVVIGPRGDLALPPGFAANDGNFRLDPASALVDQGTPISGVDSDFEGQPRNADAHNGGPALPDLGWDELARSAAAFGPNQTLFAMPGQLLTTTLELRNGGLVSDTFQLSVEAPAGWTASIRPSQMTLAPRRALMLTIMIRVADSAPLYSQGLLRIRAQGQTSAAAALIVVDVGEP